MDYLLVTLCLLAVCILLRLTYNNKTYRETERNVTQLIDKRNQRLMSVLRATRASIWLYKVSDDTFTWLGQNGQPVRRMTTDELERQEGVERTTLLRDSLRKLISGDTEKMTHEMTLTAGTPSKTREMLVNISVLSKEDGKPSVIIGVSRDVTDERHRQAKAKELMLQYQSVFSTAMTDMMYFDEKGVLRQVNQRSCETFQCDREELLAEEVTVGDMVGLRDLRLENIDYFHATQVLNLSSEERNIRARKRLEPMYYELQLVPIFDDAHKLLGIYGSGRDVTEIENTWRQLRQSIAQQEAANQDVRNYIDNINYVLAIGGVSMVNYHPDRHELLIFNETDHARFVMTQAKCLRLTDGRSQKEVIRLMELMDTRRDQSIDAEIGTLIRTKDGQRMIVHLNFIPIYDAARRVDYYFGMCRDITSIKATERRLKQETAKAQETEVVKNAFLENMSYEIRTPLSAIVGFAELFSKEHTEADEQVFISQIKQNSSHLLALINDILFLSRLDAHMLEINRRPIDFAAVFEQQCRMGWMNHRREEVEYVIENPYTRIVVDIDDQNLGVVIGHIASNAAQYTEKGTVKARYDYLNGKLVISMDDTGCGIPKEKLPHIFERFVGSGESSTGLGLSICQELVTQMGGNIDVRSTPGRGTIVWITIPCAVSDIERK